MIKIIGTKGGYMVVYKGRLASDLEEHERLSSALCTVPQGEEVVLNKSAVNRAKMEGFPDKATESEIELPPPSDDEMATMFDGLGEEPKQEE